MPGFRRAVFRCTLAALLASAPCIPAQQTDQAETAPPPPEHLYTLHVYTDLLQIPALVLDERGAPIPNMNAASFQLQLDAGPVFHPTAVHPEAQDPLTLAFVIDASGAEKDLVNAMTVMPNHGLPSTLLPHDHVSVYAFDCRGLRSSNDEPADVALKRNGLAQLLNDPVLHQPGAPNKTCRNSKHVWDVAAYAATQLAEQPGRRALLLVSDGEDRGSKVSLQTLQRFAVEKSISIFVLREGEFDPNATSGRPLSLRSTPFPSRDTVDALPERTGGLTLLTGRRELPFEIDHFITLLRSRYILQFPRPANESGGEHQVDVHVANRLATVRTAGVSVPTRDPALMNDPNTVPSDTSKMPVIGKGKPPR